MWWRLAVCPLPQRGGGYRVWVRWRRWLLVVGHRAVRVRFMRSLGVPLVFPGPWASSDLCGVRFGVPWGHVCGTGVSQPGGRGRVVPRCVGPPLSGSRSVGSAVCGPGAGYHVCGVRGPVNRGVTGVLWRPPWVVSGCVWLGCILSMVGGRPWARVWRGPVLGQRLVEGAGASLSVRLPWCLLGVSRGVPWSAGCGLLRCTSTTGPPLCVAGSLWGLRLVVGAWRVSVLSVWFAVARHVSSSAVPLRGPLRRCMGGGLGLGGSWDRAGHAESGWLWGGGLRACVGLHCNLRFSWLWCPRCVCPLLPPRFSPLPFPFPYLFACLFLFFAVSEGGECGWSTVFAVLGVGVGACRFWCWCGRHGAVGQLWRHSLAWVPWGMVDGRPLSTGFPVCVSALRHPVPFGFRGTGQGRAGGGGSAAVAMWRLCGWSWLSGSAWVAWPDAGVRVGVFLVRAVRG